MSITGETSYDTFAAFIEAAQTPLTTSADGRAVGMSFVSYEDDCVYFNREGTRHVFQVGPGEGQAAHVEFQKRIGNRKFFNDNL
jgi:hypothetical protein